MKLMLEHLVNKVQKEDLEILFGEGSKVKIDYISYSTNTKKIVVHSTVFVTNLEDSSQSFPDGLDYIINEGWKYTGLDNKITHIGRIDVI